MRLKTAFTGVTALTATVLVVGCASGSRSSGGATVDNPTHVASGGRGATMTADIQLADERYAIGRDFPVSAQELFEATVAVYEKLDIEITELVAGKRVGNRRLQARRRLAGERLSKYLRCGVDVTGRPMADSYVATIDVVSEIVPISDIDARLETTVGASARKPGGTSTDPVRCTSRGGLEERIADMVRERLAFDP